MYAVLTPDSRRSSHGSWLFIHTTPPHGETYMPFPHLVSPMDERDGTNAVAPDAHERAGSVFVDRARSRVGDDIAELYVFGSTVRGETHLADDRWTIRDFPFCFCSFRPKQ